jgi:hypothetical protein
MAWFQLEPAGSPTDPQDYTLEPNPTGCIGTDQICAVQATDNAGHPVLSAALKDEMINALHNRTASTNVKLRTS